MQEASQKPRISEGCSSRLYDEFDRDREFSQSPKCSDECSSHRMNFTTAQAADQFCTYESSSTTGSYSQLIHNSQSTLTFPAEGSPTSPQDSRLHQSPHNFPNNRHPDDDLSLKLQELETHMLGSSSEILYNMNVTVEAEKWKDLMERISRGEGGLKEVLFACAKAVEENNAIRIEWLLSELRTMVSVSGRPIQRLGAYMLEGLVARLASSGSSIYTALTCKELVAGPDLLSYMHVLYEICPYFKFGYLSANGAIADAMKDEDRIHIMDFQISQGSQWISLIQALAARPGGAPKLRITGIDDFGSAYARGGGLEIVGRRLAQLAESCNVPFEFHGARVPASEVEFEHLGIQPGEAIAVNFPLMLHHVPDESVCSENHRDRLIRLSRSLSPRVVTLVEQESNTNTAPFYPRFMETFDYYSAVFESVDVVLPRDHKERIRVEQHCLARDIVNLIACEGMERVERHEPFGKWRSRFTMGGFHPYPLSSSVNATIRRLLRGYCESYTLQEWDGALFLGWMNRPLVFSCAWS